jgi:GNAT superfamily N-acetyltransferase
MDTTELATREHQDLIETWHGMVGNAGDAVVRRDRGVVLVSVPLPVRIFNQVFLERDDADPEALTAAVETMRERGAPYVVDLRAGTDDRWRPQLEDLGLSLISPEPWMPGMALYPLPPRGSVPVPEGLDIRVATDESGLDDHISAAAAGFGMPVEWLRSVAVPALLSDPAITVYAGYADGEAVVAGLGHRTGDTIGIYDIATVESARRRGYGAAMTMRIVDDAAAAGCDVAILQASDMGLPIYERLGFRTVVEYMGWIDPPAVHG